MISFQWIAGLPRSFCRIKRDQKLLPCMIKANSHFTWCPASHVCTAMPFFLSHFFTAALSSWCWQTFKVVISMWLHYVDDTFAMWKHGDRELQSFLDHGQCAKIQYTMEEETEGSILILDVHVKQDGENWPPVFTGSQTILTAISTTACTTIQW